MVLNSVTDVFLLLTVVECRSLNAITNGQVNHSAGTTFGQTATYSCDTGYTLEGNSTRTCQANGMWSGSEPTCQGVLMLSTPECTKNLGDDFTKQSFLTSTKEQLVLGLELCN